MFTPRPHRRSEDAALSIFGGNDFDNPDDEDSERFLESTDESLRQSNAYGLSIAEVVAKIVNETFSTDLVIVKRKRILEIHSCEMLKKFLMNLSGVN